MSIYKRTGKRRYGIYFYTSLTRSMTVYERIAYDVVTDQIVVSSGFMSAYCKQPKRINEIATSGSSP